MKYSSYFKDIDDAKGKEVTMTHVVCVKDHGVMFIPEKEKYETSDDLKSEVRYSIVDGQLYSDEWEEINDNTVATLIKLHYGITTNRIKKSDIYDNDFTSNGNKFVFDGNASITKVSGIGDLLHNTTVLGNAKNLRGLLSNCSKLVTVDTSDWKLDNCTSLGYLFMSSESLFEVKGMDKWNTQNVTDMRCMFTACNLIKPSIIKNVEKWNTENVQHWDGIFQECGNSAEYEDITLDLTKWVVNQANINCEYMFSDGPKVKEIDMSTWDMSSIATMSYMFNDTSCQVIRFGKNISENVEIVSLFGTANKITDLYFANENTEVAWKRIANLLGNPSIVTIHWNNKEFKYDFEKSDWIEKIKK